MLLAAFMRPQGIHPMVEGPFMTLNDALSGGETAGNFLNMWHDKRPGALDIMFAHSPTPKLLLPSGSLPLLVNEAGFPITAHESRNVSARKVIIVGLKNPEEQPNVFIIRTCRQGATDDCVVNLESVDPHQQRVIEIDISRWTSARPQELQLGIDVTEGQQLANTTILIVQQPARH